MNFLDKLFPYVVAVIVFGSGLFLGWYIGELYQTCPACDILDVDRSVRDAYCEIV